MEPGTNPEAPPRPPDRLLPFDLELEVIADLFTDQERTWVRQAWDTLSKSGLGQYSTELERGQAIINFIAFIEFYDDWREKAWLDGRDMSYHYLEIANALELPAYRIGQLVGTDSALEDCADENEFMREAIEILSHRSRAAIVSELMGHYGGLDSFFVALWNSNRPPRPADYDRNIEEYENDAESQYWQQKPDEILNDADADMAHAYTWLDQGAEPL
jgi:hypothetical protein